MDANERLVAKIVAERDGKKPRAKKVVPKEAPAEKPKIGRPRKYDPAMLDEVLLSAIDGATWDAIGDACGIDPYTARDWCDPDSPTYEPAFHHAVKRANDKANNMTFTSLFHRANGYHYKEEVATPSGRKVELGGLDALKVLDFYIHCGPPDLFYALARAGLIKYRPLENTKRRRRKLAILF